MYINHRPGELTIYSGSSPAERIRSTILVASTMVALSVISFVFLYLSTHGDFARLLILIAASDKSTLLLPALLIMTLAIIALLRRQQCWTFDQNTRTFTWTSRTAFTKESWSCPFDQIAGVDVELDQPFCRSLKLTAIGKTVEIVERQFSDRRGVDLAALALKESKVRTAAQQIENMLRKD